MDISSECRCLPGCSIHRRRVTLYDPRTLARTQDFESVFEASRWTGESQTEIIRQCNKKFPFPACVWCDTAAFNIFCRTRSKRSTRAAIITKKEMRRITHISDDLFRFLQINNICPYNYRPYIELAQRLRTYRIVSRVNSQFLPIFAQSLKEYSTQLDGCMDLIYFSRIQR